MTDALELLKLELLLSLKLELLSLKLELASEVNTLVGWENT